MVKEVRHSSTVIVDSYIEAASVQPGNQPNYKGLAMHALPGLHQFIVELAEKYFPAQATVLDLAAGSGAMAQRLKDSAFQVVATDYVVENFRLHEEVPFFRSNMNEIFSDKVPMAIDAIVASEIIEHLENPRHFARECFEILPPGGIIILSTPNIDSSVSKAVFLCTGTFLWFDEKEYHKSGHITPLSQKQIHEIFSEYGFEFCWEGSFGDARDRIAGSPRLLLLTKFISVIGTASVNGEIYVAVVQKPKPTYETP